MWSLNGMPDHIKYYSKFRKDWVHAYEGDKTLKWYPRHLYHSCGLPSHVRCEQMRSNKIGRWHEWECQIQCVQNFLPLWVSSLKNRENSQMHLLGVGPENRGCALDVQGCNPAEIGSAREGQGILTPVVDPDVLNETYADLSVRSSWLRLHHTSKTEEFGLNWLPF